MLLNVPPPALIDHAAVEAPPPKLAPDKVMADEPLQTVLGPPPITVGVAVTFIVLMALAAAHAPDTLVRSVSVTVPLKFAAGVKVTVSGFAV